MPVHPSRARVVTIGVALLSLAAAARADLPPTGWPQARRDAGRTGRTPEPALRAPQIQWTLPLGPALAGEPAVDGCDVIAATSDGLVTAADVGRRAGGWSGSRAWTLGTTRTASNLTVLDAGLVLAGLPADSGIRALWDMERTLRTALASYQVDNGSYPAGPDLEPHLVPTFLRAMPWNPIAARPTAFSATPSPGDYAYELAPPGHRLAMWWSDGDVLSERDACAPDPPSGTRLSAERGGSGLALDRATGATRWLDLDLRPALDVFPAAAPGLQLWSAAEQSSLHRDEPAVGLVRAADAAGVPLWEVATAGPARGGAAVAAASGDVYASAGPERLAPYREEALRVLGTAVESYLVDNGFIPPTGELAPHVVPDFIACLPDHPSERREVRWSPAPANGEYDYVAFSAGDYELSLWDEDGGRNGRWRSGGLVEPPRNLPPAVWALDAGGAVRWRRRLGTAFDDLTPPSLRDDGTLVVALASGVVHALDPADGSELWNEPLGEPVALPLAVRADGSVVALTETGVVVSIGAGGGVEWRHPTGAPAGGAPTATGDGVAYAPGSDGTLRAVERSGGLAWQIPLGGAGRVGLTTAAVQHDGWVFAGRADGVLVAVAPGVTGGGPADAGNVLRLVRAAGDVVFSFPPPPGAGLPLACAHVVRKGSGREPQPSDPAVVAVPPDAPRESGAVLAPPALAFYRLHAATCCGVEGP